MDREIPVDTLLAATTNDTFSTKALSLGCRNYGLRPPFSHPSGILILFVGNLSS